MDCKCKCRFGEIHSKIIHVHTGSPSVDGGSKRLRSYKKLDAKIPTKQEEAPSVRPFQKDTLRTRTVLSVLIACNSLGLSQVTVGPGQTYPLTQNYYENNSSRIIFRNF